MMEIREIKKRLEYIEMFGLTIPNNIFGDKLIRDDLQPAYPWTIKFVKGKPYIYGTGAKSRQEFETGYAKSTLLTDGDLQNEGFQQKVCDLVVETHKQINSDKKFKEFPEFVRTANNMYNAFAIEEFLFVKESGSIK